MAMRRLTTGDVVAAVFDSDYGIFYDDSSRQEDGEDIEDIYAYMGDAAIERRRLREETRRFMTKCRQICKFSDNSAVKGLKVIPNFNFCYAGLLYVTEVLLGLVCKHMIDVVGDHDMT